MRNDVIEKFKKKKIVAIIRGVYGEDCLKCARALYDGGIEMMEITFDQSNEEKQKESIDTIKLIKEQLNEKVVVGAGTVLNDRQLDAAYEAGAQFIVSPDVNRDIIRATVEKGMVSMPGAMTPTEILTAYNNGADFVKVFPVSDLGADYIRALRGPLNNIPLIAVGGINEENIGDFLKSGVCGAGVGGKLVNKEWIKDGEFEKISELAKKYVERIIQ